MIGDYVAAGSDRRILIVRLSAMGDIVHALPVLAAVRRRLPGAHVDWLVEARYAEVLVLAVGLRRRVVVRAAGGSRTAVEVSFGGGTGYLRAIRFLRRQRYDVALDLQGLVKSAVWARASGAQRVIGFAAPHLREPLAARFYTDHVTPPAPAHVIRKNLAVLDALGVPDDTIELPLRIDDRRRVQAAVTSAAGGRPYAVLNPGAAWPNKRWPADRFGALAGLLRYRHGLASVVTWGPGERELAESVAAASDGAACIAPPTDLADLAALLQGAAVVVSGDTGPLHVAAAVGTPIVGLYGPTWPDRNGPWRSDDEVVSRAGECRCHHKRQCRVSPPCITRIALDEVAAAVARRLDRESR